MVATVPATAPAMVATVPATAVTATPPSTETTAQSATAVAPSLAVLQPSSSTPLPSTPSPSPALSATPLNREDSLLLATIVPTTALVPAAPPSASKKPESQAVAMAAVAAPAAEQASPATTAAPAKETVRERRLRDARERNLHDRDARLASTAVAPPTGTVRIAISPWGLVEVDGSASGAAPPLTELTLAVGKHQIVVRNGDYVPYTVSVNVIAGQVTALRYKFGS
jgi:serine/threonine-protein kinase